MQTLPKSKRDATHHGAGRYHHGALRSALIDVARQILESAGPAAVALRAVAREAGVSHAAPYHHFKDKRSLLAAVAAAGFRDFARHMSARAADASTPAERLQRLGLGYVEFAVRHPALFQLMHGPIFQRDESIPELTAARGQSASLLADAVRACLPGAGEEDVRYACAAAWSLVHGMATLCNDGRLHTLIDVENLEVVTRAVTGQLDIGRVTDQRTQR